MITRGVKKSTAVRTGFGFTKRKEREYTMNYLTVKGVSLIYIEREDEIDVPVGSKSDYTRSREYSSRLGLTSSSH